MRKVTIFGSTGSIGQNTLDLIRRDPEAFQVVALTGGGNIAQLAADAQEFRAEVAVTAFRRYRPIGSKSLAARRSKSDHVQRR